MGNMHDQINFLNAWYIFSFTICHTLDLTESVPVPNGSVLGVNRD